MKLDRISDLPKEDLVSLITICRRDTRFFDGYWFINVENRFGFDQALDIHTEMWKRFGKYQAKLISGTFGLGDHPIERLAKAVDMDPAWLFWDYHMERLSDTQAVFTVTRCVAQEARIKNGRGINPDCQSVDKAYFESFAQVIDPGIRVQCTFGPPAERRGELWCEWLFSLTPTPGRSQST